MKNEYPLTGGDALRDMSDQGKQIDLFLVSLVNRWGGYDAIAENMYDCFKQTDGGSASRAQMLNNVVKLMLNRAEHAVDYQRKTTEELEAELESIRMGTDERRIGPESPKLIEEIDIDLFLAYLTQKFGGYGGLAKHVKECCDVATPGSLVKIKIFSDILKYMLYRTGSQTKTELDEEDEENILAYAAEHGD